MAHTQRRIEIEVDPKIDLTQLKRQVAEFKREVETTIDRMRDAKREAHEAIQELREAIREFRTAKREFLDSSELRNQLENMKQSEIENYLDRMQQIVDDGKQQAFDSFDSITAICLGVDPDSVRDGKLPLEDVLRTFVNRRGLPYKLVPTDDEAWPEAFRRPGISVRVSDGMPENASWLIQRTGTRNDGMPDLSVRQLYGVARVGPAVVLKANAVTETKDDKS